jgi:membrane protease YdiL (CAAX protease family)
MTMTTTYIDTACPPPLPPLLPPAQPIATRGPRPLGIWRALGWMALAALAALAGPFLYGVAAGAWNLAHPAQPMPLPKGHDLLSCGVYAVMLAAFFAVIALACRASGWRALDYLALTRPRGPWLRLVGLAFIVPLAVIITANYFGPPVPAGLPKTTTDLSLVLIGVMVIAPIAEELVFRGFLFRALADSRLGAAGAIVITALVWASLHTDKSWLGMAAIFFAGLAWGWLRWRTQSTLTTIAVHGLNNLVAGVGLAVATLAGAH